MQTMTNVELAARVVAGHTPTAIAASVGVSPSAIVQATANPDVQALMAAEVARNKDAKKFDDRYDSVEDKLLSALEKRLPYEAQSMKIRDLTQVVTAFNNMKRRTGMGSGTGQIAPVVNLLMPVQIAAKLVLSDRSEIVEIDGRTMVTANPEHVFNLAEVHNASEPKQLADML